MPFNPSSNLTAQIGRNSVSGLGRFVVLTLVYFVTYPYMLRVLGAERFGMWALALAVCQTLTSLDLGISGALLKFIPEHWNRCDTFRISQLASTGVFGVAVLGMVLGTLAFLGRIWLVRLLKITPALQREMLLLLAGMIGVYFLNLLATCFNAVLSGIHRMDLSNAVYTVAAVVQAVGVFVVLPLGYGLMGLVVNAAVMGLLWATISLILLYRAIPHFRLQPSLVLGADAVSMAKYGLNIQGAGVAGFLTIPVTKVLISRYVSLASVSFFELASGMALQIRSVFVQAAMPLTAAAAHFHSEQSPAKTSRLYDLSFRYLFLGSLPIFSVAALLAPGFTSFWLGPNTPRVAATLALLLIGWFINVLTLGAYFILQGSGRAKYQMYFAAMQTALAVVLGYSMVRTLGYDGAVVSVVAALVLAAFYLLWIYHRVNGIPLFRFVSGSLLRAFIANAMLVAVFIIKPEWRQVHHLTHLLLAGVLYLLGYCVLLGLFRCYEESEARLLETMGLARYFKWLPFGAATPQPQADAVHSSMAERLQKGIWPR